MRRRRLIPDVEEVSTSRDSTLAPAVAFVHDSEAKQDFEVRSRLSTGLAASAKFDKLLRNVFRCLSSGSISFYSIAIMSAQLVGRRGVVNRGCSVQTWGEPPEKTMWD